MKDCLHSRFNYNDIQKSNFTILDAIEKLNLSKSRSDTKRLIKSKGIKLMINF